MPASVDPNAVYQPVIGLLYIFNLIVGTGALALPKAFQSAGWVLSIVLLSISCLVSYISATYVIECLSVANAIKAKQRREGEEDDLGDSDEVIVEGGRSSFEITQRVEFSQMASMFLSKWGLIFSYISLNVYLFGDLAIYSTTVPKSFMNLLCSHVNSSSVKSSDPCQDWMPSLMTRFMVYRLCVLGFIGICLPMVLAGITKTKYIQLATTVSRWTAFGLMIVLASMQLITDGAAGHPPAADIHSFSSLFGAAVYAFMCHHSLPSLVTPMTSKDSIFTRLMGVYVVVALFYYTLSLTGSFAFDHVLDVYTLNFLHDEHKDMLFTVIDTFLALFPVFTLTTNYPIVAITLINNLNVLRDLLIPNNGRIEEESLLRQENSSDLDADDEPLRASPTRTRSLSAVRYEKRLNALLIPLLVLSLPTIISLLTDNVLLLASVTGSYPGVGVQFIIPCLLVMAARQQARSELNFPVPKRNQSPFQSNVWIYAIFSWAVLAIGIVTMNILVMNSTVILSAGEHAIHNHKQIAIGDAQLNAFIFIIMAAPGERYHVLAQLEHLQSKYTGCGHADTSRYEWLTNHHRDTRASLASHPDLNSFMAIVENESRARTRFNLLNRMIQPCGPPPEKSPLDD
ncbi:hypothetical protein WR25_08758 [Diploscapter pachys]|uniref:Amino acid transporter transmembrane domain-containing protein n=1 Tax=Diploscapter pachys TaxID=2018661 RepID=A0A2A2KK01_9BILA|nr:hypothetical protein WR25_08758 [Diploscapter pachys]